MRRGGAGRRVLAPVLIAAAAAGACGRPEPVAPLQRWIVEPPRGELAESDLQDVDCALRFEFPDGRLPAGLELVEGSVVSGVGAGLTVRGGATAPRLRLVRPLDGAQIDGARVVVSGLRRGKVRFTWTGGGGGDSAALPGPVTVAAGTGPLHDHFLADWRGSKPGPGSFRLELEPTSVAGEVVTLGELCVGRVRASAARAAAAATTAWNVTLDGEMRESLVVPAGSALARSVRIPAHARLELGVGRLAGAPTDVTLRLTADPGTGVPRVIFERTLAGIELAGRWRDLAVDLGSLPPGETTLRLAVTPVAAGTNLVVAISTPSVTAPAPRRLPNIVVVSIDTLRADHLSAYGYERPTSPHLDAWARQRGVIFRRVVAPSGWTLPSHFSLFTGLEAFRHPANYYRGSFDASGFRTLAGELRRAGYRTLAVTGGGFLHPSQGFGHGFERYRFWQNRALSDNELETHLREVGRALDRAGAEPFFLFFHTYEVHAPNPPRQPFFGRFSRLRDDLVSEVVQDAPRAEDGFLGRLHEAARRREPGAKAEALGPELAALPVDAYDSAVAYTDDRLAPLLERLSRPPFGDDTIVVVLSDHGETLAPTGPAGHGYLSLDNLLVPLIVSAPGRTRGDASIDSQVRLLDLFPTLLELAGLPVPPGLDGRSLTKLLTGGAEPGRTAFAYAASTNYGLARLAPDGVKLEWRNSPWRPLSGRILWQQVAGFSEQPTPGPPSGAPAERWIRELQSAYRDGIPGLRVELATVGAAPVAIDLVSDLIDPVSTKTPDVDVAGLAWLDIGRISATLEAVRPLRLLFERLPRREVGLSLSAHLPGCPGPAPLSVSGPAELFRSPRTWRLALPPCGAAPGASVELRASWQGPLPSGDPDVADSDLRKDLQALGYLQ